MRWQDSLFLKGLVISVVLILFFQFGIVNYDNTHSGEGILILGSVFLLIPIIVGLLSIGFAIDLIKLININRPNSSKNQVAGKIVLTIVGLILAYLTYRYINIYHTIPFSPYP